MFRRVYRDILARRSRMRGSELGVKGEIYASKMVERAGLTILARNFRIPRGEVDLIARDGETIVFIEVKTRRSREFGEPYEAVGPAKQQKITYAAMAFLKPFNPVPPCRFDVISIMRDGSGLAAQWIRDAFEV